MRIGVVVILFHSDTQTKAESMQASLMSIWKLALHYASFTHVVFACYIVSYSVAQVLVGNCSLKNVHGSIPWWRYIFSFVDLAECFYIQWNM